MRAEKYLNKEKSGESQNGALEIKDGFVKVYDPLGDGFPAIILPDPLAVIKVNDREIKTSQSVYAADKIEIIPQIQKIPGKVEVKLAEKNFLAKIKISPRVIVRRKLKDLPRREEMKLEYEEEKSFVNEITLADALQALKDKGVVYGIDAEALEKVVEEAQDTWQVVARGKEAKRGRDGFVELFFSPRITFFSYHENELSRVNYKEKARIPSVKEGDRLAKVHPPIPGEPGCLVTGKKIEPPAVKKISVFCKEGCQLDEKGTLVLATRAGRPAVEGRDQEKIAVLPLYVHVGDVDLKSGNVRFNGELKVTGDILEGMTVESQGNLEIQGNTAGARIIVGRGAIFQKNLINSHVTAGGLRSFYQQVLPVVKEIEELFFALAKNFGQLVNILSQKGKKIQEEQTGQLLALLVERKYNNLPQLIAAVFKMTEETVFLLPAQLLNAFKEISCYSQVENFKGLKSKDHLEEISQKISSLRLLIEKNSDVEGDVVVTYVQNSKIETSGHISLTGTGCYNSFFDAGGAVHIEGVFRGGKIKAGKNVFIGGAGSPGLLLKQGKIYLSPDSEASFRKVYENVQIFFGKRAYKFDTTRKMVKLYYDARDDLIRILNLT
jgi:hypothetical protein